MTETESLAAALKIKIEARRKTLWALRAVWQTRLGIMRVKGDDLSESLEDVSYAVLRRLLPSDTDEPSPENVAYIVSKDMSYEQAETLWKKVETASLPLKWEIQQLCLEQVLFEAADVQSEVG